MRFFPFRGRPNLDVSDDKVGTLVLPGDCVTSENSGFLKGRGLEINGDGDFIATQCGVVEKVNKLIYVRPMHQQYTGDVGDVVVGEITQVQDTRWCVNIGSRKDGILQLAAVSLPDNAQRKRTDEDALQMREYFVEQDIIVAEIQKVSEHKEIYLQTRTSKYGRLYNGLLVVVSPALIRRQPQHIVSPTPDVIIILGSNGWIWIGSKQKLAGQGIQTLNYAQMEAKSITVELELRTRVVRYANCVRALNMYGINITIGAISLLYDQFSELNVDLNCPEDWAKLEPILNALI